MTGLACQEWGLLWLKAQAQASKGRSVSAVLDALLGARRTEGPVRSIVGRVRFPQGERGFQQGQREIVTRDEEIRKSALVRVIW